MIIFTVVNINYIKFNNFDIFINLLNKYKYFISDDYNYYYEYKYFKNYYIKYYYIENELQNIIYFNYSGNLHRENGPALINYSKDGSDIKHYWLNGKDYRYKDYIKELINHYME